MTRITITQQRTIAQPDRFYDAPLRAADASLKVAKHRVRDDDLVADAPTDRLLRDSDFRCAARCVRSEQRPSKRDRFAKR